MNKAIDDIRVQLNNLPGKKHQNIMIPSYRKRLKESENNIFSAVMILLYYKSDKLFTCIIKRSVYNGKHSGQMALPGGKFEKNDTVYENTAIRETFEEVGIIIENKDILGRLTELIIPVSNIIVTPFVSYIDFTPNFLINNREVQNIFEFPVMQLLDNNSIKTKTETKNNKEVTIPYYSINNEVVWGATAMILSEFSEVLKRVNLPLKN